MFVNKRCRGYYDKFGNGEAGRGPSLGETSKRVITLLNPHLIFLSNESWLAMAAEILASKCDAKRKFSDVPNHV